MVSLLSLLSIALILSAVPVKIRGFEIHNHKSSWRSIQDDQSQRQSTITKTFAPPTTLFAEGKRDSFAARLLQRFQGDFDNYDQVYSDRKNGMKPKEGGGHEHFHVTLIPIETEILPFDLFPNDMSTDLYGAVLASYYFDGAPNRIFRLRLYTFVETEDDLVEMKLYSLNPLLEGELRQTSGKSLTSWIPIIQTYTMSLEKEKAMLTELKRCDIHWSQQYDVTRHSYFEKITHKDTTMRMKDPSDAFHAIMINDNNIGGVLLESQMAPGLNIRIQDELSLWEDELWINDRGHDAETGRMVYGNQLSIPYKMNRVANLIPKAQGGTFERDIVDDSLIWSLGAQYRTDAIYDEKMNEIGGPTATYKPKKKS